MITTSATRGFYVVYLINPISETIYLSLNQGTTAVYREHGEKVGREVLQRRAADLRQRASKYAKVLNDFEIDLGSEASLPAGYEASHAFGRKYDSNSIDEKQFSSDLEVILSAYEHLISVGGTTPADVIEDEAGYSDIIEAKKYYLSKRIERAPNVRPKVLKKRGQICEGCGFDPILHLNFQTTSNQIPLEVHHINPINELAEGESRRYRIPEDFLVLCPTCHRIIHTLENASDLRNLRTKLNFKLAPK